MRPDNELTPDDNDWVLAGSGKYVVFRKQGPKSATTLKVSDGQYTLSWFDPRTGKFTVRSTQTASGGRLTIPVPPLGQQEMDWVLLVE